VKNTHKNKVHLRNKPEVKLSDMTGGMNWA